MIGKVVKGGAIKGEKDKVDNSESGGTCELYEQKLSEMREEKVSGWVYI